MPATDQPEVNPSEKDRSTHEDYRQLPEGAPYELSCLRFQPFSISASFES